MNVVVEQDIKVGSIIELLWSIISEIQIFFIEFDLTNISIKNFRCFNNIDLELSPGINFFYGANGCGKTSILESAFLFSFAGNFVMYFDGILSFDCSFCIYFAGNLSFAGNFGSYFAGILSFAGNFARYIAGNL